MLIESEITITFRVPDDQDLIDQFYAQNEKDLAQWSCMNLVDTLIFKHHTRYDSPTHHRNNERNVDYEASRSGY